MIPTDPWDFSDLEEAPPTTAKPAATPERTQAPVDEYFTDQVSKATAARYVEDCHKCRGSGNFVSYSGRIVGPCFACKGEGTITYKTSPETRKAQRTRSRDKKLATLDTAADWLEANPARATFLEETWEFPASLKGKLLQYGSLTDGQIAGIDKCLAKRAAKVAAQEADGPGIDLAELPTGRYAVPDGDTRLKISVRHPRKGSRWEGYIFVDDGAEYGHRTNYGRQAPGGTYRGQCQDQLAAILADPFAASIAYGKLVGSCGVCGRKLEDEKSVAAGIGPVCAKKFQC